MLVILPPLSLTADIDISQLTKLCMYRNPFLINLDSIFDNALETEDFTMDNKANHIHFAKEFKYLRLIMNYILDNTFNIIFLNFSYHFLNMYLLYTYLFYY